MFDSVQEGLCELYEKVSDEAATQAAVLASIDHNIREISDILVAITAAITDVSAAKTGTEREPIDKKHVKNPCG